MYNNLYILYVYIHIYNIFIFINTYIYIYLCINKPVRDLWYWQTKLYCWRVLVLFIKTDVLDILLDHV